MFIQQCFIRKNTPELICKLKTINYPISSLLETNKQESGILCNKFIATNISKNYYTNDLNVIDCNINEELFMALASLRNDTDKYQ